MREDTVREHVREVYGQPAVVASPHLGCGNPVALASLRAGEVVLDLGSGAGLDALNAAPTLGPDGRFIGVDMTPAMLERARTNAVEAGVARTVEFREGVIEELPVAAGTVDVVISNCVVNLSPDKPAVFGEMLRVLKPGGRVAISDIVLGAPWPEDLSQHAAHLDAGYRACVTGALTVDDYVTALEAAGFVEVSVQREPLGCMLQMALEDPMIRALAEEIGSARLAELSSQVFSGSIEAKKPG